MTSRPAILIVALASCSTPALPPLEPPPPSRSDATLAPTARCHGESCACRPLDGTQDAEATPPPAGAKRFELRLGGSADPMWVTIDGVGTVYRPGDSDDLACFYVDLAPGPHELRYRAHARDAGAGMSDVLRVYEYGAGTGAWYLPFHIECGDANRPCTEDGARDWRAHMDAIDRGINDACGGTRFRKLSWSGGRGAPGDPRLSDLQVDVELYVERKVPDRPPCPRP